MRILLIGLLFISSLLSLQAQPKEEIRATWLTTLGGMDWPTRKANSAKGIEACFLKGKVVSFRWG